MESLEFIYWLKRSGYTGWLTLDVYPYREDGVQATTQCRKWIQGLFDAVNRVGMDAIAEVVSTADACRATEIARQALGLQAG